MEKKKRKINIYVVMVLLILGTIIVAWTRSIVNGYVDSFIFRGDDISEAMSYNESLLYTEEEQEQLKELQEQWDYFKNSHLWENVSVETEDGLTLTGSYYDAGSDKTVIVFQRYDETKDDDFLYGAYFGDLGYNILLTDMRNHGESSKGSTSFGYLEAYDVAAWTALAEKEAEEGIVLYGEGMGANAILFAAGNGMITGSSVDYIIAESPYDSLEHMASYTLKSSYRLPKFPFYQLMKLRAQTKDAGFTQEDTVLTEHLAQADIPVLFLMGEADDYIPAEYTQAVYDAYPGEKQMISANVRHGIIYAKKQQEIEQIIKKTVNP